VFPVLNIDVHQLVEIVADREIDALLARGADAQSASYRLAGKISLSSGWLRSIPFEEHGTFKLQ